MANKTGKKQGGKSKSTASKKTTVKVDVEKKETTKVKVAKKTSTTKKTNSSKKTTTKKKPASFSKSATAKSNSKKSPAKKIAVKKEAPKKAPKETLKETPKEAPKAEAKVKADFSEFETLKLGEVEKLDSKIIIRDVERETPIPTLAPKVAETPEKAPEVTPKVIKITPKKPTPAPKLTAKEIKEQEIDKAIRNATKLPEATITRQRKRSAFGDFGFKRVLLATACVATAIFAVAYFVKMTSTDMSLKVAAMQSGIDAAYPSYIPRGFTLSDVTSGSGKVSMHFKNGGESFGITEEISGWDSEALLNNYIKPTYGNDYTVVREQGLTLYMGDRWEAWVNGGVLYKLTVDNGLLTKKQMKSIATSL